MSLLLLERITRRAISGNASSRVKYSTRVKGGVLPENQLVESLLLVLVLLLLVPDASQGFEPRGQSQRPRRVASRSWCAVSAKPTAASTRLSIA
jgi:hypothetical protein